MRPIFLVWLLGIVALPQLTSSVGINCEGSSVCSSSEHAAQDLTTYIQTIDRNRFYKDGQQIACVTAVVTTHDGDASFAFCAFLQHTGGTNGSKILELAPYIPAHGCHACGSVPFLYPSSNDDSHGALTFNHVSKPCSRNNGLCSSAHTTLCTFNIRTESFLIPVFPSFLLRFVDARYRFAALHLDLSVH